MGQKLIYKIRQAQLFLHWRIANQDADDKAECLSR